MNREVKRPDGRKKSTMLWAIIVIILIVLSFGFIYKLTISQTGRRISTPAGSFQEVNATSQTEGKIIFGQFTEDVALIDLRIYVEVNDSWIPGIIFFETNDLTTISWNNMSENVIINFMDVNKTGIIDKGDTLILTGLTPDTTYSFEIFHAPSFATTSMIGSTGEFTTDV